MPTTEVATLTLVPGSDIGDPNNPAAAVVKDCGQTIAQQDGFQQQNFGLEVENPNVLQLLIDWDSKKHHEDFMAADHYKPFANKFTSILSEDPQLHHVDFKPDGGLKASMSAPVTEVATFYYEGGPPDDSYDQAAKFIEIWKKEGDYNISGWSYGITHEEIEKDGVKGKAAVLTIGWPSVQAHMDFRGTQIFKDNIGLLRQSSKAIEMHHTQFMNFVVT